MILLATDALRQTFSPSLRKVLYKTLALTLAILAVAWIGLDRLIVGLWEMPSPWLATTLSILTGLGLLVAMVFLVAPVSSLVAGFFLDDVTEIVERDVAPEKPLGRALPAGQALWFAGRFAALSMFVNALALFVWLMPGINVVAFLGANAYLLGREYFELAAMRYRSIDEARELRHRNAGVVFLGGIFLALFVAIPVLNLATPLFATAFMVRLHMRLVGRENLLAVAKRST